MELQGTQRIGAPRELVYAALNDPDILRQCIPGCETLEKDSDTHMTATVALKVGPVKAKFNGAVELSNLNPPESYTISGEGKGGAAGNARGSADVKLEQDGDGTLLRYGVKADISGKLAQLGSRLVDSTAKKLAGQFFAKFGELVEQGTEAGDTGADASVAAADDRQSPQRKTRLLLWVAIAVAVAALILVWALR